MRLLDEDHHPSRSLDDVLIAVVVHIECWRSDVPHEAAVVKVIVLGAVEYATHRLPRLGTLGDSPLPLGVHERKFPIRRIHDQRGSQVPSETCLAPVQPELTIVIVHVGCSAGGGLLALALRPCLLKGGRFFQSVELFGYVIGTLERCVRLVVPEPLEVRLAVRCPWHNVGCFPCACGGR